jgi:hypothetical protein
MPRVKGRPILIVVVALLMLPVIYSFFSTGVSLVYLSLPLLVIATLIWFVWRVFLRVYIRAARINHIRERRLLNEASLR